VTTWPQRIPRSQIPRDTVAAVRDSPSRRRRDRVEDEIVRAIFIAASLAAIFLPYYYALAVAYVHTPMRA
jgi:hypothetical protein